MPILGLSTAGQRSLTVPISGLLAAGHKVADGARQALLPVTGLFGTPNAHRGDFPRQGLSPKGVRRHQQGDNLCAPSALLGRSRKHSISHVLVPHLLFPGRMPSTLLRAAASQEGRAAPHAFLPLREGTATSLKGRTAQFLRSPITGKALLLARKPSGINNATPSRERRCRQP